MPREALPLAEYPVEAGALLSALGLYEEADETAPFMLVYWVGL